MHTNIIINSQRTEHTSPVSLPPSNERTHLSCCMHHATPVYLVGVCRSKQSVTLASTSAPSVLTRQRQYCGTCASLPPTHSLTLGNSVTVCATSLLSVVLPCPQPCTAAHRCWHAHRLQRQLLREPRTPSLTQRVGSSGFECDTAVMHARHLITTHRHHSANANRRHLNSHGRSRAPCELA
jgi:hypothetical protein